VWTVLFSTCTGIQLYSNVYITMTQGMHTAALQKTCTGIQFYSTDVHCGTTVMWPSHDTGHATHGASANATLANGAPGVTRAGWAMISSITLDV
jgi:hypothetical protein